MKILRIFTIVLCAAWALTAAVSLIRRRQQKDGMGLRVRFDTWLGVMLHKLSRGRLDALITSWYDKKYPPYQYDIDPTMICCGRKMSEHRGPICPDGLTMCALCFHRFPLEEMHRDEEGILWDVCIPCRAKEIREKEERK